MLNIYLDGKLVCKVHTHQTPHGFPRTGERLMLEVKDDKENHNVEAVVSSTKWDLRVGDCKNCLALGVHVYTKRVKTPPP